MLDLYSACSGRGFLLSLLVHGGRSCFLPYIISYTGTSPAKRGGGGGGGGGWIIIHVSGEASSEEAVYRVYSKVSLTCPRLTNPCL